MRTGEGEQDFQWLKTYSEPWLAKKVPTTRYPDPPYEEVPILAKGLSGSTSTQLTKQVEVNLGKDIAAVFTYSCIQLEVNLPLDSAKDKGEILFKKG